MYLLVKNIGFIFLLLLISCSDDIVSYKPESGYLSGKITFQNMNNWPNSGSVAIALSSNWPPLGAPAAFTTIGINNIDSGFYSYIFEDVVFNTYESIAVSWKDPTDDNSETNQHILGAYGGTLDAGFWDARIIDLNVNQFEQNNLDFIVDMGLVNEVELVESGSISGSITFSGNWPNDQVYISLNSQCCPLISTPAEFYIITSEQLVEGKLDYIFENIAFDDYYIAVFKQTNWETIGAYPDLMSPQSITLNSSYFDYENLDFDVIFNE